MALRNQPYLPLYIQDFMTDEKLMECSAESTGVYIRIMCLMHKSEEYGTILLRQKDKQTEQQINNFAVRIAKQLPYDFNVILKSLTELVEEGVLVIEGDILSQKRMVKDNALSNIRSNAGKKGGFATAKLEAKQEAKQEAKVLANSEYENVIETKNEIKDVIKPKKDKILKKIIIPTIDEFLEYAKINLNEKFIEKKFAIELKYKSWVENGWKDGNGDEIKLWKSKLLNTIPYLSSEKTNLFSTPTQQREDTIGGIKLSEFEKLAKTQL
jgi:uncharacterized protein YdaU (DUF1376 family)